MHITLVHVHVKPERLEAFVAATRLNRDASAREEGCVRFEVLQSGDDPTRFILVEMFRDAEAAAAHKATAHYHAWRDTVADWMASPREGRRFHLVSPEAVPRS